MKIIAFIMAFLVLSLSVLPCADMDHAAKDSKGKIEISKSGKQTENPGRDNCSPFCHCTCCATFSINHFIASISNYSTHAGKAVPAYFSADEIGIALPIWQPPQLV